MDDIGSQETVISSGAGTVGGQESTNAVASAAALGISTGVSDVVGGNPSLPQMAVTNQDLDEDNDDEDDDDVETFNLDDVIEAVATGTLGKE